MKFPTLEPPVNMTKFTVSLWFGGVSKEAIYKNSLIEYKTPLKISTWVQNTHIHDLQILNTVLMRETRPLI